MSQSQPNHHYSSDIHQTVQKSSTLNRKYVKRPTVYNTSMVSPADIKAARLARRQALAEQINRERLAGINKCHHLPITQPTPAAPVSSDAAASSVSVTQSVPISPTKKVIKIAVPDTSSQPTPSSTTADLPPAPNPFASSLRKRQTKSITALPATRLTAKQIKDQAISKAIESVATMESEPSTEQDTSHTKSPKRRAFSGKKIVLALTCSGLCVAALAYFIQLNMPDISVQVAAMQTGVNASYPSYIPRGYQLSDVSSERDQVVMKFADSAQNDFTLTQEYSSWDSTALLNNFVKKEWSEHFVTIREQGITIYIDGAKATWVNGGILYRLTTTGEPFTKKQITNIATSL